MPESDFSQAPGFIATSDSIRIALGGASVEIPLALVPATLQGLGQPATLEGLGQYVSTLLLAMGGVVASAEASAARVDSSSSSSSSESEEERSDSKKLVVVSTFTAQQISQNFSDSLRAYFPAVEMKVTYNDLFQQISGMNRDIFDNTKSGGANILLIRAVDICTAETGSVDGGFLESLDKLHKNSKVPLIVCVTPWVDDAKQTAELVDALRKRNLADCVVSPEDISDLYPVLNVYSNSVAESADIPYTDEYFKALTLVLMRKYHLLTTAKHKKVIAVDCDDTLWGGVVSEVGVKGLVIEPRHRALQQFLLSKRDQGFLIALLSRNKKSDVWDVFTERSDMLLHKEHISGFAIDWKDKSDLLKDLARELNLNPSSIVFIDDDPRQCAAVEQIKCPDGRARVLTFPLPDVKSDMEGWLRSNWAFDALDTEGNSTQARLRHYQNEKGRRLVERETAGFENFIEQLGITIGSSRLTAASCDERGKKKAVDSQLKRVADLLNRANQFSFVKPDSATNARAIKKHLRAKRGRNVLLFTGKDRYGDYGDGIGVVICRTSKSKKTLEVENFALSCRASGRGVEYEMFKSLANLAQSENLENLSVSFNKTDLNGPAQLILSDVAGQCDCDLDQKFTNPVLLPVTKVLGIRPRKIDSDNDRVDTKMVDQHELLRQMSKLGFEWFYSKQDTLGVEDDVHDISQDSIVRILMEIGLQPGDDHSVKLSTLGLNSLRAVQLASKILDRFKIKLDPVAFRDSSVKDVFSLARKTKKHVGIKRQKHRYTKKFHLSPQQQGIWLDQKQDPESTKYIVSATYEIKGVLDIDRLELSVQQIIEQEEVLRTTFGLDKKDRPCQTVNKYELDSTLVKTVDCKNMDLASVKALVVKEEKTTFDLSKDRLIRVSVFQLDDSNCWLHISFHHIIMDGTSFNRFLDLLSHNYQRGLASNKSAPKLQYIDYAQDVYRKRRLSSSDEGSPQGESGVVEGKKSRKKRKQSDDDLLYWKGQLNDARDLKISPAQYEGLNYSGKASRLPFIFDKGLTDSLKSLSLETSCTLYSNLLSAYVLLLARFSSESHVTVLTAARGRDAETSNMMGHFTKLFPVSVFVHQSGDFVQLASDSSSTFSRSNSHSSLPYSDISRLLRDNGCEQTPYGFSLQDYAAHPLHFGDLQTNRVCSDNKDVLYDNSGETRLGPLAFYARQEDDGQLHWLVEYDESVFDQDFVRFFFSCYESLLRQVVNNPRIRLSEYQLNSPEKKMSALFPLNENSTDTSLPELLDVFSMVVASQPDSIAVESGDKQITYSELDKQSNQLANALQSLANLENEDKIAVCISREMSEPTLLLAIMKLGCAYVSINPEDPVERINYILKDTGAKIFLYGNLPSEKLKDVICSGSKIASNKAMGFAATQSEVLETACACADSSLAHVIYTSGSTGKPKGVMIERHSVVRLVVDTNYMKFQKDDRVAQVSNSAFDAHTFEFWGALLNGSALVYSEKSVLTDADNLSNFISVSRINVLFLTTTLFEAMAFSGVDFSNLDCLAFGGGKVDSRALKKLFEDSRQPKKLFNGYGPTEFTTFSTYHDVTEEDAQQGKTPIGSPISGTKVYVLDHFRQLLPVGAVGEIYLAGTDLKTGLSRGYLNLPELTEKSFFEAKVDGIDQRLYATGDRGYVDNEGQLHFISRIACDKQVKLAGCRVELSGVEMAIGSYSGICQVVVTVKKIADQDRLFAYFSATEKVDLKKLKQFLGEKLPNYMVPVRFLQMPSLPVNKNGKLDVKQLPEIAGSENDVQNGEREQSFPAYFKHTLEGKIKSIFGDLLDVDPEKIGGETDFFHAGGNSLAFVRLLSMINKTFGFNVSSSHLFEECTPAAIKSLLKAEVIKDIVSNSDEFLKIHSPGELSDTVVVLIHPAGGHNICYRELISALKDNFYVCSIEDPSIHKGYIFFDSIEEIADAYIRILNAKFPGKKIIPAGWSFGGMVSYQMCSVGGGQLQGVFLLDSWLVSKIPDSQQSKLKAEIVNKHCAGYEQLEDSGFMKGLFLHSQDIGFTYAPDAYTGNATVILFKAIHAFSGLGLDLDFSDDKNFLPIDSEKIQVIPIDSTHDDIVPAVSNAFGIRLRAAIENASLAKISNFSVFCSSEGKGLSFTDHGNKQAPVSLVPGLGSLPP